MLRLRKFLKNYRQENRKDDFMVYGSLLTKCGVQLGQVLRWHRGGSGTASYQDNDAKMYFMEAVD